MKGKPDVELRAEWETVGGTLDAFLEEHAGADAALAAAANDRGKVTRAPCRNASGSSGTSPTIRIAAVLTRCITLMDAATAADMAARAARTALDRQVFDRYAALADAEIRTLAVDEQVARRHLGRHRRRGAAGDAIIRGAPEGAGKNGTPGRCRNSSAKSPRSARRSRDTRGGWGSP